MTRTQTTDKQHGGFAFEARAVFVDDGLHWLTVFFDDFFHIGFNRIVETFTNGA